MENTKKRSIYLTNVIIPLIIQCSNFFKPLFYTFLKTVFTSYVRNAIDFCYRLLVGDLHEKFLSMTGRADGGAPLPPPHLPNNLAFSVISVDESVLIERSLFLHVFSKFLLVQ